MTPSPTNSAIAAAAKVQRYELVSHGQYSMRYESLDEDPDGDWVKYDDYAALLAKLAEVEAEAITNRLALALWMNGGTPNQPLIDDIERWRQEVAARVYQDEAVKASLTRAEQSEALLREAHWIVAAYAADHPKHTMRGVVQDPMGAHELSERIDNHLAPKETT